MAYFLSPAVLNRKTTIIGTALHTKKRRLVGSFLRPPFVQLKKSSSGYLIITDATNLTVLIATLRQFYAPLGLSRWKAYSDRALLIRGALFYDTNVMSSVDFFISSLSAVFQRSRIGKSKKIGRGSRLSKAQYVLLFTKVYRALVNDRLQHNSKKLEVEVERDFAVDKGYTIQVLLMSLVDFLTPCLSAKVYSEFLSSLLMQIIDIDIMKFRPDESIRIDPKRYSISLTQNWTEGFKKLEYDDDLQQQEVQNTGAATLINNNDSDDDNERLLKQKKLVQPLRENVKVVLPSLSLSNNSVEIDVDAYLQRFQGVEFDGLNVQVNSTRSEAHGQGKQHVVASYTTIGSMSSRTTLMLPLSPPPPDDHSVATQRSTMNLTTSENPVGVFNSMGLKVRKVKEQGFEEFQVAVGKTLTRRKQTDLTVAMRNSKHQQFILH
jgi:hypothetical protein